MKKSFLAGLTPAGFLRRHWQREPLLVRNALARHARAATRDELFELATRDDVESRVVLQKSGRWSVRHGPFDRDELARLPRRGWTLLVQGVDQALRAVAALKAEFAFLSHARLDDVMVSYAAPGGGVGPHFDSYDVFLVQGEGQRRWRIGAQADLGLVEGAPLRILRRFAPEREWVLRRGDVLYLPPRYAHEGVAEDECITYSIGFRAPAAQELGESFLDFLRDRLALAGRYTDRRPAPTRNPGRVPEPMLEWGACTLSRVRWSRRDVTQFVGVTLSEPRPGVVFARPTRPLSPARFARAVERRGIELALATRMLYRARDVYMNGERCSVGNAIRPLAQLADARELPACRLDAKTRRFLYGWYLAGYIAIGSTPRLRRGSGSRVPPKADA